MAGQNGAYYFKYVSIWTVRFDAVFGQRLRLPKNANAFFGIISNLIFHLYGGGGGVNVGVSETCELSALSPAEFAAVTT